MPGSSPTMARRDPTSRLNSVDLPTLGRPTMAMREALGMVSESSSFARPDGSGNPSPHGLCYRNLGSYHTSRAVIIETLCLRVPSPPLPLPPVAPKVQAARLSTTFLGREVCS